MCLDFHAKKLLEEKLYSKWKGINDYDYEAKKDAIIDALEGNGWDRELESLGDWLIHNNIDIKVVRQYLDSLI